MFPNLDEKIITINLSVPTWPLSILVIMLLDTEETVLHKPD